MTEIHHQGVSILGKVLLTINLALIFADQ